MKIGYVGYFGERETGSFLRRGVDDGCPSIWKRVK